MELGATVCKPVNPECGSCPISGICQANAAWQKYVEEGGDPDAADAPRATSYPGKVSLGATLATNPWSCCLTLLGALVAVLSLFLSV